MRVHSKCGVYKKARCISILAYLTFILFLSPPVSAQSLTHTTRLSLPVSGSATVVVENKEGVEKKSIVVSDYLSSTKVVLDEKGTVVQRPEYYPYGNTVESNKYQVTGDKSNQTDSINQNLDTLDLLPDTTTTDRLYTGQRKVVDDSPIYNYNARYYNPDIGLFIQPDTIEGINRFAYVGGNPVMRNDPSGHMCNSRGLDGEQPVCSGNGAYAHNQEMSSWSQSKEHDAMLIFTTGVMDVYNMGDFDNTAMGISNIGRGSMGKGGGFMSTARRFWEDEDGRFFNKSNAVRSNRSVRPANNSQISRTYDSVMSEANKLFNQSNTIRWAQYGIGELNTNGTRNSRATLSSFFDAMRSEGVIPVVDEYGRYSSSGFHTSSGNPIRTLDVRGVKYLIINPNLNSAAINGETWAVNEIYEHGVHDFAAVKLGYHTTNHPHQGLASGFHYLDYLFQQSIGKSGSKAYDRFLNTRNSEWSR